MPRHRRVVEEWDSDSENDDESSSSSSSEEEEAPPPATTRGRRSQKQRHQKQRPPAQNGAPPQMAQGANVHGAQQQQMVHGAQQQQMVQGAQQQQMVQGGMAQQARSSMPPIMGGSMCAVSPSMPTSSNVIMGHPSAHSLQSMSAPPFAPGADNWSNGGVGGGVGCAGGSCAAPIMQGGAQPMSQGVQPMPVGQFQPQGFGQQVPAVGQIAGPQRWEPVPFDDRNPQYGNITSTYPVTNELERPMANLPNWQTPVLPLSRSKDTSPYDVSRSPFQLFAATGMDQDSWRPKREQGPMFTPQPQNITGMPAQAQVQRDRYQPSNELRHQTPFQAEWSLRTGGFHPTTRILPTNVPVQRQVLPSFPVSGPKVSSHPSGLFGESRGELGLVERRGFDTSCYYKMPFPTTAPVQAAPQWAKPIDKPTARQFTSRPYGGGADATGTGASASYVTGKYVKEAQRMPSQVHERIQQGGGPMLVEGGASTNRYSDVARPTMLEATENATMVGAPRPPVAAGTAHPMDVARPTMLEFTEQQTRPSALSAGSAGMNAPTVHFQDVARPTMLEGTEQQTRQSSLSGGSVGMSAPSTYFQDVARPTMLEGTEQQTRQSSLSGGAVGMSAPSTYFQDVARPTMLEGTEQQTRQSSLSGGAVGMRAPTVHFQDVARPTMLEGTEQQTRAAALSGGATGMSAPSTYFQDVARPTMLEGTEQLVLVTNVQSPYGAPQAYPMDVARPTIGEGTELATAASISGVMGQSVAPMTYLMDTARATLKQFTSNHAYEGGAGQGELVGPMQTSNYTQNAHLNEKLEVAMNVDRAPVGGDRVNVVAVNGPRVGYGDPCTVRVRDDNLLNLYGGLTNQTGQGMNRWIPEVTVRDQKQFEESWQNDRNNNYVLTGLMQNPYAIPPYSVGLQQATAGCF